MPDQRGDRRPKEYPTSVLGRVDWACWLAVAGLLFLTVVAVLIQFAILGVFTALLAVGLVAFDSWVNRPDRGPRPARRDDPDTGWRDDSAIDARSMPSMPPVRAPQQSPRPPQAQRPPQPQRPTQVQRPPQPQRPAQRPSQAQRSTPAADFRGGGFRPDQAPQSPQPRPPYRPAPPDPGRDQDFRARR
jgi:hypothetical protein